MRVAKTVIAFGLLLRIKLKQVKSSTTVRVPSQLHALLHQRLDLMCSH